MRIGSNPEKAKNNKIYYYQHRVIVPVYIPTLEHKYYEKAYDVFKKCIDSLLKTIDIKQTAITIIDNNCCDVISHYISQLLLNNKIQKVTKYHKNKGKVYTILSEIKSAYEEYITVTDADVFFMNGWFLKSIDIFNHYPKAAFVSPLPSPSNYKYLNRPLLINELFNLKKDNLVTVKSFKLYEEGVMPKENFFEGKKWNWKQQQYILKKENNTSCVGATHFIFTIKKSYTNNIDLKGPVYVFKNGDERKYIEKFIEKNGGYRLSTIDTNVYHMGNSIEKWVDEYKHIDNTSANIIANKINKIKYNKFYFFVVRVVFKIIGNKIYNN